MAGLFDLEGHLVFYRSYHFNHTNVAIHLVCIPIILLSAITFLTAREVGALSVGTLIAWGYGIYYVMLDWKCGLPSFALLVTYSHYITQLYQSLDASQKSLFVQYAMFAHVAAWLAQFYGHGVHEKRAPALLDNLLQAIVLAPFFVAFEIAFFLGFRKDLKKTMDNKAGVIVRDFKLKEKAAAQK